MAVKSVCKSCGIEVSIPKYAEGDFSRCSRCTLEHIQFKADIKAVLNVLLKEQAEYMDCCVVPPTDLNNTITYLRRCLE